MTKDTIEEIKLLLVDDETDFRSTLAKRLGRRGIRVQQAGSGHDGLELLDTHPVDVVVMDVKMPGLNGIETLKRVKKRHNETEVIMLTGHTAPQDGVEGIKSGAFDYLTKPVEIDHLLKKVRQAYDQIVSRRQEKEAAEFKARVEQQMVATERLAAMGTMAAGIAHEINNPLAIINEACGILLAFLEKEELTQMPHRKIFEKALGKIETSVKRARSITHQMLGNVRKTDPVWVEVDLTRLVEDTLQLVRNEAGEKNVSLVPQTSSEQASIWGDANQIRQVLINLLSNAIFATPAGGKVSIQVEAVKKGAVIAIKDSGSGIPKENLDKIFDPFFSTKAPGEGTGLGLFVTREIIDNLGGEIHVDSRLGHGTKFTVTIPDQVHV